MKKLLIFTMAILLFGGCATFLRDSYRTLAISQQTHTTTLSAFGDLYKQGQITEEQKMKVEELGDIYALAHNSAVALLLQYQADPTEDAKQRYLNAAAKASLALADFIAYTRPILMRGGN